MGARSAGVLEREDAGRLIDVDARRRARIDVGHAVAAALRIEIGVEDAAAAAKLKLEAVAFEDLKRGLSEMADQLIGGEAEDLPRPR